MKFTLSWLKEHLDTDATPAQVVKAMTMAGLEVEHVEDPAAKLAPFTVAIAPVGYDRSEAVREAAERLYAELADAGVEVLLDDRGERPGVMFADLELIGIPHRVTIGDRGLKEGKVEYQGRRDKAATAVPLDEIAALVRGKLE